MVSVFSVTLPFSSLETVVVSVVVAVPSSLVSTTLEVSVVVLTPSCSVVSVFLGSIVAVLVCPHTVHSYCVIPDSLVVGSLITVPESQEWDPDAGIAAVLVRPQVEQV